MKTNRLAPSARLSQVLPGSPGGSRQLAGRGPRPPQLPRMRGGGHGLGSSERAQSSEPEAWGGPRGQPGHPVGLICPRPPPTPGAGASAAGREPRCVFIHHLPPTWVSVSGSLRSPRQVGDTGMDIHLRGRETSVVGELCLPWTLCLFNCGKYTKHRCTISTILKRTGNIKSVPIGLQPSPPSVSRTLLSFQPETLPA